MQLRAIELTAEHWSFLWVEKGCLSRTLAFDYGHSYTPAEYAMKMERGMTRCPNGVKFGIVQ